MRSIKFSSEVDTASFKHVNSLWSCCWQKKHVELQNYNDKKLSKNLTTFKADFKSDSADLLCFFYHLKIVLVFISKYKPDTDFTGIKEASRIINSSLDRSIINLNRFVNKVMIAGQTGREQQINLPEIF